LAKNDFSPPPLAKGLMPMFTQRSLRRPVIPRIYRMSPGGKYILQKNLLTANGAMATQQFLRENMADF
jgi:hypothetical protein